LDSCFFYRLEIAELKTLRTFFLDCFMESLTDFY